MPCDFVAYRAARRIIRGKRSSEVVGLSKRRAQRKRVARCLGNPLPRVRANNEGGIAKQRYAFAHHDRRCIVEYCLDERRSFSRDGSTKLRRKSFLSNPNKIVTRRIRHGTCWERILMNMS